MASRQAVVNKARAFLGAVGREVQAKPGLNLAVSQQAVWWSSVDPNESAATVRSSSSSSMLQSNGHEREIFNGVGVNVVYQTALMHKGFAEQTELLEEMKSAGVQVDWMYFGFLLPLVSAWCKLPAPFDLSEATAQVLLDEFAEAVIDGVSVTRYRDVLASIDVDGTPIELEEGVRIRRIEEQELWELGSGQKVPTPPFSLQLVPADSWCILEIHLRRQHDEAAQIGAKVYAIREAIVANLLIALEGGFTLVPIGMTNRFGPNATGMEIHGSDMPRQFGRLPGMVTVPIDSTVRQQLRDMWPRVKGIMLSPNHYLSLPLRRLIDGAGRMRSDDRIVDYTIGLEALLLRNSEQDELNYRFALRGATVLGEVGEEKHQAFKSLKDVYTARSKIVHGSVSKLNLNALADNARRLLCLVWKWHLAQGLSRECAIERIEQQILGAE